jgi:hypothetical protein
MERFNSKGRGLMRIGAGAVALNAPALVTGFCRACILADGGKACSGMGNNLVVYDCVRGPGTCEESESFCKWSGHNILKESISLDFSRSNARGRSDLHSPTDAWTPQTHESSGIRQDRRGNRSRRLSVRAATLASQRPVARGFASRSTGLAGHVRHYTSTLKTRATTPCSAGRLACRPRYSARRAKVGFRGEFGGSRAARADSTDVWVWNRRPEQLARIGRPTPRPWERRMLRNG